MIFLAATTWNRIRCIRSRDTWTTRFGPGLWVGAGLGYGAGGRSTPNHIRKDDRKENLAWVISVGYPLSPKVGFKLAYVGTETMADVGIDSNSFSGTMSVLW